MKPALLLLVCLSGCTNTAPADTQKPDGEQVFDVLFKSLDLPLDKEPMCNLQSTTRSDESITLGQHLATIMSLTYESDAIVTVSSSCAQSKHEDKNGGVIDIWDCKLEIMENSQDGQSISSSMIAFSTPLDKISVITGSLRCL